MELETVNKISRDFFEKMGINLDNLEVSKEDENIFYIKVKTNDSPLLIWYSGKNLENIKTVLKSILSRINWENLILHLEVNDYISKKEDKLHDFIRKKIEIVKSWKEVILPFFNSYERKKIHSYVARLKDETIFTKSIWEWKQRRLHICKVNKNITIDVDWIDI